MAERGVAIISGGSSGIGAAVAADLAAAGLAVVITYNSNAAGAETVAMACRKQGVEAVCVKADVADDDDCRRVVSTAIDSFGRLDVLINNAGMTRFADATDFDAVSAEDFDRIFRVNVTGSYQLARAATSGLRQTGGAIVNISSHSGFSGMGSSIAYAASKGALNTLTLGLARSLAPDIRVNAVCPGFVDTDWMAKKLDTAELADFKNKAAAISPLQRLVSAAEVAEAVHWFALGGASITGQLLVIDGGTHLTVSTPV